MVTLDEAITKVDSYINELIKDIILFRKKRIEASEKVLSKLSELMDKTTYLYRLGELYDKVIKVEKTGIGQADITRPRITLSYTGGKTPLTYNGYAIEVPSVPVFIWEPKKPDLVAHEAGIEAIRRNVVVKFPIEADVEEPSDFENTFGKYYFLEIAGWSHDYIPTTEYAGKKITMMGMIMEINTIAIYQYYLLQRQLTVDGNTYFFNVNPKFGKVIGTTTTVAGAEVSDVEYPCTLFTFFTDYGGDCSAIIFGNEYTRGPPADSGYIRDILLVYFNGTPIMFLLR